MAVFKKDVRTPRRNTQHHAWILLAGGFAKRKCTILDLSATGARIALSQTGSIGNEIGLALTADVRKITRCRLIWRTGTTIGVQFIERT